MHVRPVECLQDNYAWVISQDGHAVVVDPSEAGPVLAALDGLVLDAIWCTHHHADHVGGVQEIVARHPVPVVGGEYDRNHGRIPGQTLAAADGELLRTGRFTARVHTIPGHTLGAIAFETDGDLLTGDMLFAGGCGRVFEGTMPMMRASLARLAALHPRLRIRCGHEYTVKNLEFAVAIAAEPAAATRLEAAREKRAAGKPAVGEPLAVELETNPFLRWEAPNVRAAAARLGADPQDPDAVFAAIRHAKDRW
jgi:hydroxyacylglutathione hydrolase